jgi:hypothetical protein
MDSIKGRELNVGEVGQQAKEEHEDHAQDGHPVAAAHLHLVLGLVRPDVALPVLVRGPPANGSQSNQPPSKQVIQ